MGFYRSSAGRAVSKTALSCRRTLAEGEPENGSSPATPISRGPSSANGLGGCRLRQRSITRLRKIETSQPEAQQAAAPAPEQPAEAEQPAEQTTEQK